VIDARSQLLESHDTCASSPVRFSTNHHSRVANHQVLIGTAERLESLATHRKQTIATHSNRYRSRQGSRFLSRWFTLTKDVLTPAKFSSSSLQPLAPRMSTAVPGAHRALAWQNLPETANRVEAHVSHRKQTMATPSTRDAARARSICVPFRAPAASLQFPTSATLACPDASGVTSTAQRPQDRAACIALLYALGADPDGYELAIGNFAGWRLL
jgi:hypothetical protein